MTNIAYPTGSQIEADYVFQTPHNAPHLGWLFGQVFGVRSGETSLVFPPEYVPIAAEAVEAALLAVATKERVIRMRLGLTLKEKYHSQQNVADYFGLSRYRIRQIESKAVRKLRHPSRSRGLKVLLASPEAELRKFLAQRPPPQRLAELVPVIEKVMRLEPSVIAHLQRHNDDLLKINPILFEHLFAGFLGAHGFDNVV
jgi:biotin operon repressor